MNPLMCYEFNCGVCGAQSVWAKTPPTACPTDAGHDCSGIVQSTTPTGMAMDQIYLHDADRIFRLTVDQNGTLSTDQVSGPDPA